MTENIALKRTLTLGPVVLYGVGTILGAGIYVLIGEVAGAAGVWAPLSFVIAAGLAAFTGLSFAELSNRYPVSAGEAVYVQQAFNRRHLSLAVGLLVVLTGIVSSATLVNGFAGYFREFIEVPNILLIPLVCILLGGLAAWGITQSVIVASVITVTEVGGLIAVVVVAVPDAISGTGSAWPMMPGSGEVFESMALWAGILSGAGIAFYAFIGFEDMVNVAEEVKDVRRVMPRAIILALSIAAVLYVVVAVVVVRAMPLGLLIGDEAPLSTVFETATGKAATSISVIALFAVINGALIQVVMAARVLYGASTNRWLPPWFGRINARTQTPVVATVIVTLAVLVFALWLPLGTLARLTSLIILVIFTLVNVALVRIKMRDTGELDLEPPDAEAIYRVSLWVPVAGAGASAIFGLVNLLALTGEWFA